MKPKAAVTLGLVILAGALAGCGLLPARQIDCKVVQLDRQSGRTQTEIASTLGVNESEIAICESSTIGSLSASEDHKFAAIPQAAARGGVDRDAMSDGAGASRFF